MRFVASLVLASLVPVYATGLTYSYLLGKFSYFDAYPRELLDVSMGTVYDFSMRTYLAYWVYALLVFLVVMLGRRLFVLSSLTTASRRSLVLSSLRERRSDTSTSLLFGLVLLLFVSMFIGGYSYLEGQAPSYLKAISLLLFLFVFILSFAQIVTGYSSWAVVRRMWLSEEVLIPLFLYLSVFGFFALALHFHNEGRVCGEFDVVESGPLSPDSVKTAYLGSVDGLPYFFDCGLKGSKPYVGELTVGTRFISKIKVSECVNLGSSDD